MAFLKFGSAVSAVPQLGHSCTSALTANEIPGSGLKVMRLVSRQLRTAMLGIVQGYTLQLDGKAAGLLGQMNLLESVRLSHLRVVLTDDCNDGAFRGLGHWSAHRLHLQCFMSGMGAAIRNVTHLELTLPPTIDGNVKRQGMCELLSQLAASIPEVLHLQVGGDISRSFLASFGASCSHLHSLKVLDGVPSESLVDLHLILPRLTHCAFIPGVSTSAESPSPETSPCILSLLSCTSLTDVDVGLSPLLPDMWNALPPRLRRLQCSCIDEQPANLSPLTSLESLTFRFCMSSLTPEVNQLVPLLRVAPNLKAVTFLCECGNAGDYEVLWMDGCCIPSTLLDLVYLNERALAGLTITSIPHKGAAQQKGINVLLWVGPMGFVEQQYMFVSEFLAQLPPLPGITGILLSSLFGHASNRLIIAQTAARFPNLDTLEVNVPRAINSTTLTHLGPCTVLQHLKLCRAQVCPASLALLCARLPALESLCLWRCEGFTAAAGALLQEQLHVWGVGVKVHAVQHS